MQNKVSCVCYDHIYDDNNMRKCIGVPGSEYNYVHCREDIDLKAKFGNAWVISRIKDFIIQFFFSKKKKLIKAH